MKKPITLLVALLATTFASSTAFANDFLCKIDDTDKTFTLKKIKDLPVSEKEHLDFKISYNLQVQDSDSGEAELNVNGIAKISDVNFNFKSDDKKISLHLFMDDSAGSLTINAKEQLFSGCETTNDD